MFCIYKNLSSKYFSLFYQISMQKSSFKTCSAKQTTKLGTKLAPQLRGQNLFLFGELGLGKTTFIRGLAQGLGISAKIKSPTFVLEIEYPQLIHFDFYRLAKISVEQLARLKEVWQDSTITVAIEWSERIASKFLPEKRVEVRFFELENETRRIDINL
jgi:tRNA threonylcarbamoyladenosine biosynthesis protein TsaE